ncbi:hypothetical protein IHQ71_08230 [Rhizobium sp. TH2]|uniref:glycerate kinase n=1 Tax=Rhizobium sp. TH2 TaxID=2775403 RepID=UPI002157881D|nr:glycerate kinase [Rhizobium sp. TH2]UVC10563.1 hypothetical protein IHQ71_08230 [Rhizobium sp. TH2]
MSDNPDGFEDHPQMPLSTDDEEDNVIDESIFGPQKTLTAEEQAEYDAWLRNCISPTTATSQANISPRPISAPS